MYYGGFMYAETWDLPVVYKRWYINRVIRELNKGKGPDGDSSPSRALHTNSPEVRQLLGRDRPETPARLRRFT
jgi:hypothetical protein